jgi:hypothetical protein
MVAEPEEETGNGARQLDGEERTPHNYRGH